MKVADTHIDTLQTVKAQSELLASGPEADIYCKGIIPEGYILKLHHDPAKAAHEVRCLEAFAKEGLGGGFYGLWAGRGILQRRVGDPNPFVQMVPGKGLVFTDYSPLVDKIPMDFAEVWEKAFTKLHAAGVAHYNISPENIVFDAEHNPRMVDMGSAVVPGSPLNDHNHQLDKGSFGAYDRLGLTALKDFFIALKERRFTKGENIKPGAGMLTNKT
jgi:hypothetical protein